jgi:hypothetical protein
MSSAKTNPDPTPKASVPKFVDIDDMDTGTASDAGAEIELKHPTTKAKTGIFVTVLGKHGEVFREHIRERTNERIKREANAAKKNDELPPPTAEQVEEKAIELLVLCTLGWRSETRDEKGEVIESKPVIVHRGQELPFTVANAKMLYARLIWMREQIDEAIGDLENFIKV